MEEKGYASKNISFKGNTVFNTTVHYNSSFFERLIKPTIQEWILCVKLIGSKYMVMSIKAQINSLKLIMNTIQRGDCKVYQNQYSLKR